MDITACPECGVPAEVTDRFVLESTGGAVEHARVRCAGKHWFLLPVTSLRPCARPLWHAADPVPGTRAA